MFKSPHTIHLNTLEQRPDLLYVQVPPYNSLEYTITEERSAICSSLPIQFTPIHHNRGQICYMFKSPNTVHLNTP
jgi:hypothetical protein